MCRSFVIKNTFIDFFCTHRFRIITFYDPSNRIDNYIEKRQLMKNEEVGINLHYTMIFLKWNRLNQNCSGSVFHREIMSIASERPLKTVYATFFTFWAAAL